MTEFQKASVVWPERVRPLASVIVPEIMTGTDSAALLQQFVDGEECGLGVERVEIVSTSSRSTPPSSRPRLFGVGLFEFVEGGVAAPGSLTSGESEALRLVAPIA